MSNYEELRRHHVADARALAPKLIERLDWAPERLAAHRAAQLRKLAHVAVERSPWHRKRLADVNPDALDEAALGELPVMTKDDLMEHFDDIVTDDRLQLDVVNHHLDGLTTGGDGYLFDRYTAIASSGSTGRRGVFVYDWDGWATFYLGLLRYLLRAIDTDPKLKSSPPVMASVAASHPSHATAAMSRTFSGAYLVSHRFPVTMPTEQIVAGLNEAQPALLQGYASALHLLTHEAKAGRLRIAPKRIITGAEPLLPEIRAALEETWEVRVGAWWGTSEGGPTGAPCDLAETHLTEDLLIVEPVDESGLPVAPGERSAKIYLTNLYNHTLPLIRYEITDEVTILEEPCPCGSAHRRIADIQGRLDDTFVYRGLPVHPHVFRSQLGREHNIVEYQVRQTAQGAGIALRCAGPVELELLRNAIVDDLERLGLPQPDVSITVVDAIDRQVGGKLRRFVRRDVDRLQRDGAVLEYAVEGVGEPVLLIHPSVTADGLAVPLLERQELTSSYRLIAYHRRGYGGSTTGTTPVSIADQAADAAALLAHLGVSTAHVVGHSYGGVVALQLAHDRPGRVHSLALLEPSLMTVPSAPARRERTFVPAAERYRSGDKQGALDLFLTEVFGPGWRAAVEAAVPGAVSQAEADVDVFFGVDLPSLQASALENELVGKLNQPILSVVGTESPPFRLEGRQLLHEWFGQVEDFDLENANHLLQMQNPGGMANGLNAFFRRHPIHRTN